MNFSQQVLAFLEQLHFPVTLPQGIHVLHPFADSTTLDICRQFYNSFYNDTAARRMIIGINPGRFGGGITGIPFTDPVRLQENCGISNPWPKKQELSSVFVYKVISAMGGPAAFYKQYYITAISPLGFTRNNRNLNYYDDWQLQEGIREFVIECMNRQLDFGIDREVAYCLGDGKNYKYLKKLNDEQHFFSSVIPLSHPRFIMQYRLKRQDEYLARYVSLLKTGGAG